ncbi:MAG: histidine kinase, partial [FCB group bacterium]|nr:histidine kinase [FCB group bacterium]
GDAPELGAWDPAQAPILSPVNDTLFTGTVLVDRPRVIEYKITRGSWSQEALTETRQVPPNSVARLKQGLNEIMVRVPAWKDAVTVAPSSSPQSITGDVRLHPEFYSPQLDNLRMIRVWLPPSYADSLNQRYPVLYCHDGQNIFEPTYSLSGKEWGLDELATELITAGRMDEIIIVGIDNLPDVRTEEYSPMQDGNAYADFLIHTVKPFIDSTYRTLPDQEHTAVMGSSMGGIISFDLAWEHPDIFSRAFCLSPAFLVDRNEIVKRGQRAKYPPEDTFFLIWIGTEGLEVRLQPTVTKMVKALKKKGWQNGREFDYRIVDGARHSESDWARQCREFFPRYLKFSD